MKSKILLVLALIAFAAVADVKASLNMYIKTNPAIPGEVTTPAAWLDAWQVLSFSLGVSNPTTFHSGTGYTSGTANFSDLAVMKLLDKASVASLLKLAQGGSPITSVTLSCVNSGTNALVYEIKLEDVFFSSIQHSGSVGGDDKPAETVSFVYGKITWTYYPPSGPPITHTWNIESNTGS